MKTRFPKPDEAALSRLVTKAEKKSGHAICGAWRSTAGRVCLRWPSSGRERCRFHGGETPRGVESGSFKHGRYSKSMPERLLARFRDGMASPDLYDLRSDIAFANSLLWNAIERFDTVGVDEIFLQLERHAARYDAFVKANEAAKAFAEVKLILSVIRRGASEGERAKQILELQRHKASLLETNRRLLHEGDQTISAEQVLLLIAFVTATIRTYVDDRYIETHGAESARIGISRRLNDAIVTGDFERVEPV